MVQHARRDRLVPWAVQPRDVEVIAAVWRHRFLTAPQLLELWWPGGAADVGRRRLRKLWAAGHLERFRPVASRGSFPWTYQLGREGHRVLRGMGLAPSGKRFESREVYDYRYVLHVVHLNSWVIAWRRLLPQPPVEWLGEQLIEGGRRPVAGTAAEPPGRQHRWCITVRLGLAEVSGPRGPGRFTADSAC